MSELLPCPFCGGETGLKRYECGDWQIICYHKDGCIMRDDLENGYFEDADLQAVIRAWNSRAERETDDEWEIYQRSVPATEENMAKFGWVRERTCKFVIEDNMKETEGMGDVWFRCTSCNTTYDYYADDWLLKQNYCPHCGAKVVSE